MAKNVEYILTTDEDSHWYVIPADKEHEWNRYCEKAAKYWWNMPEDEEPPEEPMWAVSVGGAPSLVRFSHYRIE